jgi:hypothetical protein
MFPPPTALGLTLCEKVIIEEGTKNITLVNTFTKRVFKEFPSPPEPFFLVAALTGGMGDATIRWVANRLDTFEEITSQDRRANFPDRLLEAHLIFRINECSFPAPGRYQFTLLIDGDWIAHRQLNVRLAEEQP